MFRKSWNFTCNLTKLSFKNGEVEPGYHITYPNRIYLTLKGWAGLYLVNIVLFGYKLWFGFIRNYSWVGKTS